MVVVDKGLFSVLGRTAPSKNRISYHIAVHCGSVGGYKRAEEWVNEHGATGVQKDGCMGDETVCRQFIAIIHFMMWGSTVGEEDRMQGRLWIVI